MIIKVEASDIKIGMFVAELDRPWLDTPFLFQGFLVEQPEQLVQLRRHCAFVMVDCDRSLEGMFPKSKLTPARKPGFRPTEAGGFEDDPPAGLLGSVAQRFRDLFGKRDVERTFGKRPPPPPEPARVEEPEPPARVVHHDFIPETVQLTYHHKTKSIEEEIVSARKVYNLSEEFTKQVFTDIRTGKILSIDRIEEVIHNVVDSMVRNPDALMWVAHLKQQDTETYSHDLQVAVYLVAFGRNLSLPREHLDHLCMLGLLLDIGKTKVSRELLTKPGWLTPEEFDAAKQHVDLGLELLRDTPNLHPDIFEGLAQHHEREDGSGYPSRLSAGDISLYGRMAGIVDTFVAITNVRPYAEPLSAMDTLHKLTFWSGKLFHKPLVEQFIQAIGVFPVGSLVELSNGEVAVVVRHSKVRRLQPRVLVVCGPDKVKATTFRTVDLLQQPDGNDRLRIVRGLPAGAHGLDAHDYYLS